MNSTNISTYLLTFNERCSFESISKPAMKQHVEIVHERKLNEKNHEVKKSNEVRKSKCVWVYKCTICSENFQSIQDVTEHSKKSHEGKKFITVNGILKPSWVLKCTECFTEFSSKPGMIEHVKLAHKIQIIETPEKCEEKEEILPQEKSSEALNTVSYEKSIGK